MSNKKVQRQELGKDAANQMITRIDQDEQFLDRLWDLLYRVRDLEEKVKKLEGQNFRGRNFPGTR
jgi:hypothetical protein